MLNKTIALLSLQMPCWTYCLLCRLGLTAPPVGTCYYNKDTLLSLRYEAPLIIVLSFNVITFLLLLFKLYLCNYEPDNKILLTASVHQQLSKESCHLLCKMTLLILTLLACSLHLVSLFCFPL